MSDPGTSDEDLIASITPDVMRCLAERGFFQELDNRLCPTDTSNERHYCDGSYQVSKSILASQGFDEVGITDVFAVLGAQGGYCDCEVLYNVVEISRLKAEYWRAKAEGREPERRHNSK